MTKRKINIFKTIVKMSVWQPKTPKKQVAYRLIKEGKKIIYLTKRILKK